MIVTVRDGERFIEQCLSSISASRYANLDIVVVDDGSEDSTREAIEAIGRSDPRIRAWYIERVGRRAALDLAHGFAAGALLCWVDADDVVHPDAIGACVRGIDADHQLVYTYRDLIDRDGRVVGSHAKNKIVYRPNQLLVDNMIFHLRMFTSELFARSGGVGDLESAIDWDMNLRMAELTTPRCIPRRLYSYRVHDRRMSGRPEQREAARIAVERAIQRRGIDAELVIDEGGWRLRRRQPDGPTGDRPAKRRLHLPPEPSILEIGRRLKTAGEDGGE